MRGELGQMGVDRFVAWYDRKGVGWTKGRERRAR